MFATLKHFGSLTSQVLKVVWDGPAPKWLSGSSIFLILCLCEPKNHLNPFLPHLRTPKNHEVLGVQSAATRAPARRTFGGIEAALERHPMMCPLKPKQLLSLPAGEKESLKAIEAPYYQTLFSCLVKLPLLNFSSIRQHYCWCSAWGRPHKNMLLKDEN